MNVLDGASGAEGKPKRKFRYPRAGDLRSSGEMGRGLNCTDTTVVSRSRAAGTEIAHQDFLAAENDPLAAGELISYGDFEVELLADDPVLAMRGLAQVSNVVYHPSTGHHEIFFGDGSRAIVSLDPAGVALQGGDEDPALIHGALYAAQAHMAAASGENAPSRILDLGDAELYRREAPNDPEGLRLVAKAAVAAAEGNVAVNPSSLSAELGRESTVPTPVSARKAARLRRRRMATRTRHVIDGPTPELQASSVLYDANADGMVEVPDFDDKLASARRLGGEHLIPKPRLSWISVPTGEKDPETGEELYERKMTGEYHLGPQEDEFFSLVRNRIINGGQRFMTLRGPQGTGKNAAVREMAAMMRMPLVQINLGPRWDLNDSFGGEGLGPAEVYDDVPVIDPKTGLPKVDPDTDEVVTEKKLVTAVAASRQVVGVLARALQEKCVVCLDEIEGMEADLVQMHGALGSDVGDPTQRFLSINSMSGTHSLPVDPDCIIVATFNSGPQEVHLPSATHDRALNFDFEYPPKDEEDAMLATMVTKVMANQPEAPGLQREYTGADVKPIGDLVRRLREAHRTEPDKFIDFPGGRQASYMFLDLMLEAYRDNDDAVRAMSHTLRYLMPGWDNMSRTDRDANIREQVQEFYKDLNELVQLAHKIRAEDEQAAGGTPAKPKAKAKAKGKRKPKRAGAGA